MLARTYLFATVSIVCVSLAACGGGSSSQAVQPPPPATVNASIELSATQVPGNPAIPGTATADLTINLDDGGITGSLSLENVTATAVRLSEGFAGQEGEEIAALSDDGDDTWSIPAGTTLSADQLTLLDQGGIFVDVTTAEYPDGALRGQIVLGNQQIFVNLLNGEQEIPPVDSSATAFVGVTFNPDDGSIIVHVTATGLDNAEAGHVHDAYAGTNGGVLIGLDQDPNDVGHWLTPPNSILDTTGEDALLNGRLYVNLHSPEYPAGELRGQILSSDLELVLVELSGGEEVPPVATDATANGALTLDRVNSGLELHVTAFGLDDATAAHVHVGFAGTNGGVEIELVQDPNDTQHWLTPAGTVLSDEQLTRLDRGEWYLNLHTPEHPPGEVRGQISPGDIEVIIARLDGLQEVPAINTTATGIAGLTVNNETAEFELHITSQGVDDAVAAHIHQAFAGANGGVLFELEQDPNDVAHWFAPVDSVFDESGLDALNNGELYLNVHTPAIPAGEIRGQLIPDGVELFRFPLTGGQSVPAVVSTGSAYTAITVNRNDSTLAANINTVSLDDAVAAHIHAGLAGDTGPVEIEFEQDANDVSRWQISGGTEVSTTQQGLLGRGALYVNLHTPANPAGEVRGQIVPRGIEVLFTTMAAADVVPSSPSIGSGIAATTIEERTHVINSNVNLTGLDDAGSVSIHQAPVMQNGPALFSLIQDVDEVSRWQLVDQVLDDNTYLALRNQGLYIQATTPSLSGGAIRGQLEPSLSNPSPANVFSVVSTSPTNGSTGEAPGQFSISFNREPLVSTVDDSQFEMLASGGDASFGDGNETLIVLPGPTIESAQIRFDLDPLSPDVYRFRIDPDGVAPLTDASGVVLDGDGDGNPGGVFIATFEVEEAPTPATTLTELQVQIFTPTCATSGCHSGGSPAQGMNLSAGQTFANTVNVPSAQNGNLDRIEPNDADNSYLVQKVEGTAAGGGRMPLGQPALSNDQIQAIRSWIEEGAQDN